MSGEQPAPEQHEVLQYAEEVDQEIAGLRAAAGDLIDLLDATGGFIDLEAGCGGDGPVVRRCRLISKPPPARLKAWLEGTGTG